MSRSAAAPARSLPRAWPLVTAAAAVLAGAAAAAALLPMTAADLGVLVLLLGLAGGGTAAAGLLLLRWMDARGTPLVWRAFAAGATGAVAALANVLAVAAFMFVNTGHDLRLLLAVSVSSGGVAALVSAGAALETTRRVRALSAEIERLATGDYRPRAGTARPASADEVGALAVAIEELRGRLREAEAEREALDRERRELSTAISHDLRTPLSAMRAAVDALSEGVVTDPADVQRYHERIRREVDRLARLVDDLFELARLEGGQTQPQWQLLPLHEIAAEVVDGMQPLAERAGVRLDVRSEDGLEPLPLDGARIERAVGNLLRNAIQHAPPGSAIEVRIEHRGGMACLVVRNEGEAIPAEALPRIWERFYRVEQARGHGGPADADGAGLGLAIVRAIVEWHGGSVHAASAHGDGTRLGFTLPLAR